MKFIIVIIISILSLQLCIAEELVQTGVENTENEHKKVFLANSTVTNKMGEFTFSFKARYYREVYNYSYGNPDLDGRAKETYHKILLVPELTYGLYNGLEIFSSTPYTFNSLDDDSFIKTRTKNEHGFSDISLGLRKAILPETFYLPSITLTFQSVVPIGSHVYGNKKNLAVSGGHWISSVGVGVVKNSEPAVIYTGLLIDYYFPKKYAGKKYEPGLSFSGYYGIGFAINDSLSVNTAINIKYREQSRVNGRTAYGTDSMPMTMTVGTSYQTWRGTVWSVDVDFGLNSDAPEPSITFGITI